MLRRITISLTAACAFAAAGAAGATNFTDDVGLSIDLGLGYLDTSGAFNNPSSAGDAQGLVLLALLEKRPAFGSAAQGYAGASALDQARMRRVVRSIINNISATGASFYAYRDGGFMMALSVYMRSGGPNTNDPAAYPEFAGAPMTLVPAYNQVVDRTLAAQRVGFADSPGVFPENNGYWCYFNNGCRDASTTQLTVAGLSAARGLYSDAAFADATRLAAINTAATRARTAYVRNGNPGVFFANDACTDGTEQGHGYNAGNANSIQQTASGTWVQLVGGADLNDPNVQHYLRWIRNRFSYTTISNFAGEGWPSYWYYLWTAEKAFSFIRASGVAPAAGNISPADLGTLAPTAGCPARQLHRNPAADVRIALFGANPAPYYGAESADWYYDFAYEIMRRQLPSGQYADAFGSSSWGYLWDTQAYALLVLQRSTGGGCIDTDGDGVCDNVDNCRSTANPNQEDGDHDGVGNVCDNCPLVANPGQEDGDHDGIGDACEEQGGLRCDVDADHDVDRNDINLITAARNTPASGPNDPRDNDHNGVINVNDARQCTLLCTLPRCAIP